MLDVLEAGESGVVAKLHSDATAVLDCRTDVRIRSVAEADTDAGCSVAGAYIDDTIPPTLAVAHAVSTGRRLFTLLHEFGHHVQQVNTVLQEALLDQSDGGHALEDAACDAFATAVLLPEELVDPHMAIDVGPTADNVVSLWQASRASRAAVCVRAAERLPSPGHVLLLNENGEVDFAAASGLPPVRRHSSQTGVPLIRDALSNGRLRARGTVRLAYRDGILGGELYAQAANMGGYLLVVAVLDRAPWETFAPPSREQAPVSRWRGCEHCGHEYTTFDAGCGRCGIPPCPECGRCSCPSRVAERTCEGCNLTLPARMFDGASARCRDCA